MGEQLMIPAEYADTFKAHAHDSIGYAASNLQEYVDDVAADADHLSEARARLERVEALWDQIADQPGSLVVDVDDDAVLDILPCLAEAEAVELSDVVTRFSSPETIAATRRHLDAVTFWVEMIESLSDEMFAANARWRAIWDKPKTAEGVR